MIVFKFVVSQEFFFQRDNGFSYGPRIPMVISRILFNILRILVMFMHTRPVLYLIVFPFRLSNVRAAEQLGQETMELINERNQGQRVGSHSSKVCFQFFFIQSLMHLNFCQQFSSQICPCQVNLSLTLRFNSWLASSLVVILKIGSCSCLYSMHMISCNTFESFEKVFKFLLPILNYLDIKRG